MSTRTRFSGSLCRRRISSLALGVRLAVSLALTFTPSMASAAADQTLRLTDHPGIPAREWGGTLVTSGDWLALGALSAVGEGAEQTGRVLLWKRVDGLWQAKQVLAAVAPAERTPDAFGRKVVMDGKRMVVASEEGTQHLHTYVLKGDTWVFDGLIKPQAGDMTNDSFGGENGIAISGDTVAVGTLGGRVRGFDLVGWVDVFQRTGAGWTRTARLTDTRPLGSELANTVQRFGYCVGLQRDMLFAAVFDEVDPVHRIVVFKRTGAAWMRQRDLFMERTGTLVQSLYPSPAGDRLFVGQLNRLREYSLTRPYELISDTSVGGSPQVWGKSLVWCRNNYQSASEVCVRHQLPDRTWVTDHLLGPGETGVASVKQAHLTGRELMVSGSTSSVGGTFHIRCINIASQALEFDHSGNVTEAPPVLPASDKVGLLAGEYVVGKEVKPIVTISAFHPVPAQGAGLGTAPIALSVGLTGDEADFSIPAYQLTVQPGKKADLKVNFKPLTPGPKRLLITFSRLADPAFVVRYEITAQAVIVTQAAPVQITRQPQSGLYGPFEFDGLHVQATGTQPINYRWLRNGAPVPGGTGASLWPKEGGIYTVEVSNGYGLKAMSEPAALGFYAIQQPVVIVPPDAPARCAVALSGTGLTVQWQTGYGPLENGPLYAGVSSPVLNVKKAGDPEAYQAFVTMPTPQGGELSRFSWPCMVFGVLPPEIQDFDGEGTYLVGEYAALSPPYSYGNGPGYGYPRFAYSGLPPGMQADAFGTIYGTFTKPGIYSVQTTLTVDQFTVRKTLRLTVRPNSPLPGFYWGLINPQELYPDAGTVLLDVTPTGSYTGNLWVGTTRIPLAGFVSAAAGFCTPDRPYPVKVGGVNHVFWLRTSEDSQIFEFYTRPASVPADSTGRNGTYVSGLTLMRKRDYVPEPTGVGRFNFCLLGDPSNSELNGQGFGTLNISASGRGSCVGQLPDGTSITASVWQDEIENTYFHIVDPRTRTVVHLNDPNGGGCYWQRPAGPGRLYPQGFSERNLSFFKSRYRVQPGQPLLAEDGYHLRLNVPGSVSSVTGVTFTSTHKVRFGSGENNPWQVRMDVHTPTGFFTGQFTLREPDPSQPARTIVRTVQYRGMLLTEHGLGMGYFLVPALPDPAASPPTTLTTSPILSGAVLIDNSPFR